MSEIFRERTVESPSVEPTSTSPLPLTDEKVPVGALKTSDIETAEERNLTVWEELNHSRFVDEYFNTKNTSHEFIVKMPTSEIDKFVRGELQSREMENTVDNYKSILQEIEQEIGSNNMELFKRFNKLTGYIRAIMKLNKAKALKASYLAMKEE